ncbi:hypothetical protein HY249_03455 [Candidatus Azambacteria bacterium]|nr:hypothetical protein [Candidatus Azambacteria bacterium]
MMKKHIFKTIFILPALVFAFSFFANAQNPFNISFPIAELGNCGSMNECKAYCDLPENSAACMSFAESRGIAKKPEIKHDKANEVLAQKAGPGGCTSRESCDAFCRNPDNRETCFNFAKENGLIPKEKLAEIENEIKPKEGPGGCTSRESCEAFCKNPDNAQVCLDFAVNTGRISKDEADTLLQGMKYEKNRGMQRGGRRGPEGKIDKQKADEVLAQKAGPGGCTTKDECEAFCQNPDNVQTCLDFAVANDLIPKDQAENMKKMMTQEGPGGCRGIECKAFCEKPENAEACFKFAKENGLIDEQEAKHFEKSREIIKKLEGQGGGPGGCKGGDECRAYCSDPTHIDECAAFSANAGFADPEKVRESLKEFSSFEDGMREGGMGNMMGGMMNASSTMDNFGRFDKFREEFKKRGEFCSKPENAKECEKMGPPMMQMQGQPFERGIENMMPQEGMMPQGMQGGFPGIGKPFRDGGFKEMPKDFQQKDGMRNDDFRSASSSKEFNDFRGVHPEGMKQMEDGIGGDNMMEKMKERGFNLPQGVPQGFPSQEMPEGFKMQFNQNQGNFMPNSGFGAPQGDFHPQGGMMPPQGEPQGFKPPEGFTPQILPPQSMHFSKQILANPLDILFNLLK